MKKRDEDQQTAPSEARPKIYEKAFFCNFLPFSRR